MCIRDRYETLPSVQQAGGFAKWLRNRLLALCRTGIKYISPFAGTLPPTYVDVLQSISLECGQPVLPLACSSEDCASRPPNATLCTGTDLCCAWDSNMLSCTAHCAEVQRLEDCVSSWRCAWDLSLIHI
eukprot:TRINITY_DN51477_c0_g2_i1.p4 TRINITY_DN51477_c0_g2~~TRINITY_DN51477_c0_g2_i1.p4  ORF type:complete len:129 (-),score=18.96 TRINITY_DN51477_c0_g2_i1:115-501(-)